ncbi:InlB B-repeat-containing protein [Aminicella lysinilytica]|uniref:Putative repeat protein (TIGR02543 family) n=1 Tax=Aminicella lysinilytica TaxID=433323 RepID=A0A4R6PWP9_9FIRM|nr:InlB B-repeat-containing protein [Aminicella lysinilytica]TDP45713.1 putative repeat protein (TIGR02543 family) [Aminicella lysinilytica]
MKKKLMAILLAVALVGMYSFGSIASVFADDATTTTISLDKTAETVYMGKTLDLTATVTGGTTSDATWVSSNENVATVKADDSDSTKATVTAEKISGTSTITVTSGSATATCVVTVKSNAGDEGKTVNCKYYVHSTTDASKITFGTTGSTGQSASNYTEGVEGTITLPSSWSKIDSNENRFYTADASGTSLDRTDILTGVPSIFDSITGIQSVFDQSVKKMNKTVEVTGTSVTWYVIKKHNDGYHVDGYVTANDLIYALNYDKNTSEEVSNMPSNTGAAYKTTETATLDSTNTPVREGYTFKGWALSRNSTTNVTSVKFDKEPITVYAIWEQKYSAKYDWVTNAPTTGVTLPTDSSYYDTGDAIKNIDKTYTKGYTISDANGIWTFSGWDEGTLAGKVKTYTGSWTFKEYPAVAVTSTYNVIANYYTSTDGGEYVQDNSSVVNLKDATVATVGSTISVTPEDAWATYNGNTYGLDESKSTLTKTAVRDPLTNTLTLSYYRSVSSDNGNSDNNNADNNNNGGGSSSDNPSNNNSDGNGSGSGSSTGTAVNTTTDSSVPDTGDNSELVLWSVLGLTSIALGGVVIALRRKEAE